MICGVEHRVEGFGFPAHASEDIVARAPVVPGLARLACQHRHLFQRFTVYGLGFRVQGLGLTI